MIEERPEDDLAYPGDDPLGLLWERPPRDQTHVPDENPKDRTPYIAVLGSSGFRASWQSGVADVLERVGDPVRWDLTSGGTLPGLTAAAGLSRHWRRIANAGFPSRKVLRPPGGLRWWERRNLDLGGVYDMSEVEAWLADWLSWAGVETFRDLRYEPGEIRPADVSHRAGICVSVWRTDRAYPQRCTDEQLRDPEFVHRVFRWAFYGRQFPWRKFRPMWIPDTVGEHLPWLKSEIDDHSPAHWARISMSQWPACLPTVLQDPRTLQLVFLIDGGHIDNQPTLFNDGRVPPLPLLNARLAQNRRQQRPEQRRRDARRMPFGRIVRLEITPETDFGSLNGRSLTLADRDAMWRRGRSQAMDRLPGEFEALVRRHEAARELEGRLDKNVVIDVPGLHPFQFVATARRPRTRRAFDNRS